MRLTADIFLALRYLRPKRTFISVITLLSVLGPILGVALLIIVTSVMSGFDRDIRERILDMQAHIQVLPTGMHDVLGLPVFDTTEDIMKALNAAGAEGSPIIEGPILIQLRNQVEAKYVRGIVPETEKRVTGVFERIEGKFNIAEGEALIGEELALQLGMGIGDQFLIHSPKQLAKSIHWDEKGRIQAREADEGYLPEEVTIAGIFSMGVYEYDASLVLVHIDQAADLFGLDWGSATSVHARVPDPFSMDSITNELRQQLPQARVVTWQEANQKLFGALRVEKNLMFFLLTFIVIVAAFGIAGTLITVAVQKTREIGILKAIGMSSGLVARVFMLQGTLIGMLGTAAGTGLGLTIIHYRNEVAAVLAKVMGVEIFPKELYHLSQIPALVTERDVLVIVGVSLVICMLASLVPALYAAALSPARALQEEN